MQRSASGQSKRAAFVRSHACNEQNRAAAPCTCAVGRGHHDIASGGKSACRATADNVDACATPNARLAANDFDVTRRSMRGVTREHGNDTAVPATAVSGPDAHATRLGAVPRTSAAEDSNVTASPARRSAAHHNNATTTSARRSDALSAYSVSTNDRHIAAVAALSQASAS